MNRSKNIQVKVGIILICLILAGLLFPPASSRGAEQNNPEGIGNNLVYLPVLRRPFLFNTSLVSVASDGTQGNNLSGIPAISVDGRYVAFASLASNLVSGDTNGYQDIFVHDLQTKQTTRVSVASDGTQGNGRSGYHPWCSISGDGRYVAFASDANNLVSGDNNDAHDVFVHDRQTGQTTRISIATNGTQSNADSWGPSISADGRYVAFTSYASNLSNGDTNNERDAFVHDRQTGQTNRVSIASDGTQGNDFSAGTFISADGRYVAFNSQASNLVSGDTNGQLDVFVHDRQTGQTSRISVASDGTQGNHSSFFPSLSTDGRYVAFISQASNLVNGDTNNQWDIFVHDQQMGQTSRVSVDSNGVQFGDSSQDPSISANGRYVAFRFNSWDIYLHDRQTGQTSRVSVNSQGIPGNGQSEYPAISGDGRYVAFFSLATNLVHGGTSSIGHVFVYDRGE